MLLKPLPDKIVLDLEEIRAVERALDALPYGSMDPSAKEVRAKTIADYRKAKAERDQAQAAPESKK